MHAAVETGAAGDPVVRERLVRLWAELRTMRWNALRTLGEVAEAEFDQERRGGEQVARPTCVGRDSARRPTGLACRDPSVKATLAPPP
ncbi:hypothetical protein QFZ56_006799 [Streptomyces achromogenes]|uniref:Uncharacterized protein n=1 Tax=Streptomyces achromogenes TaxID=67255 RepID=A0ABU0QCD1_STRAH|nr:hypothetical protein [Streptomyces achromogenes]